MSAEAAHVLVVDDDERIRDLLKRFLSRNGSEMAIDEDGTAEFVSALLEAKNPVVVCGGGVVLGEEAGTNL